MIPHFAHPALSRAERYRKACEFASLGASIAEGAEEMEISTISFSSYLSRARRLGVEIPRHVAGNKPRIPTDRLWKLYQYFGDCASVARAVGYTGENVWQRLKRAGKI